MTRTHRGLGQDASSQRPRVGSWLNKTASVLQDTCSTTDEAAMHHSSCLRRHLPPAAGPCCNKGTQRRHTASPQLCPQALHSQAVAEVTYLAGKPGSWCHSDLPHQLRVPANSPDLWPQGGGWGCSGPAAASVSPSCGSLKDRFCHWSGQDNFA